MSYMTIINSESYPYITTWNWGIEDPNNPNINKIELRSNALVFHLRNFDDRDYWYIEFLHGDAFVIYDIETLIPPEYLEKIKNGDVTLILSNSHEGYHTIVESIYQYVIIKHNINPDHILIFTESADLHREIDYVAKKYNSTPCKCEMILEFEHNAKWNIINDIMPEKNNQTLPVNNLLLKNYEKKYICLNGIWRAHRSAIVALLNNNDVIDKGFVSFNSAPVDNVPDPDDNFNFLKEFGKNNTEFLTILEKNKDKIKSNNRLYLDAKSNRNNNLIYGVSNSLLNLVTESYFTIVTETNCTNETHEWFQTWKGYTGVGRILSEKTFKPIVSLHPFILVSVPYSLELLRQLGYKTFHPWIDESYDKVEDDAERILIIYKEVERLCSLSEQELSVFLTQVKKICVHNFQILRKKTKYNHILPIIT